MGAFDTYSGSARCPACGAIHFIRNQTKVFDPDYFNGLFMRDFSSGPQELGFPPLRTLAADEWDEWDEWCRVRERGEPGRIAMLEHPDKLFGCSCGQPLAMILHFECSDEPPSAALLSIELRDAFSADLASRIDLASSESMSERDRLQRASFEQRVAYVRAMLEQRFEGHERWLDPPPKDEPDWWTHLVGPASCESCGAVRERALYMAVSHWSYETSVLGEGWTGGVLRVGTRIRGAADPRAVDEDRGYFLRLRSTVPEHTLTLCGGPESWGCACGVGPAWAILRLRVEEREMVVESISVRSLQRSVDLDDVDYVYAPGYARGRLREPSSRWRPRDRAEAIALLLRDWKLTAD